MAKVVVKSKAKKIKRKFPVEIKAPEFLNSALLGNCEVTDLNNLVGKSVKMNLMYVTGSLKNQNVRLKFTVTDVASGLAKTRVSSYEQVPYYLGRYVKKGADLIEDSFEVKSKDGIAVVVKPFVVTKVNSSSNVLSSIRSKIKELVRNEVAKMNYDDFLNSVLLQLVTP